MLKKKLSWMTFKLKILNSVIKMRNFFYSVWQTLEKRQSTFSIQFREKCFIDYPPPLYLWDLYPIEAIFNTIQQWKVGLERGEGLFFNVKVCILGFKKYSDEQVICEILHVIFLQLFIYHSNHNHSYKNV